VWPPSGPASTLITGLIKANFPSRISFRVATRVDSRTVLDVMGAEHLLGKGDMLFLPPGSSRLTRVHGAFVTEAEINRVVECWKAQSPSGLRAKVPCKLPRPMTKIPRREFEGGDRSRLSRRGSSGARRWAKRPRPRCSAACARLWPRGSHSRH